jgi:hypothetical protein
VSRLDRARANFETRIRDAASFVSRSQGARQANANRRAYHNAHIEWIHEAAALKMVVASEQFFETTLGLYAIGERTRGGYRPRRRRHITTTLPSMLEMFRGDQDFLGWNEPSTIIRRADRWLRNGEPYQTTLSAASQVLNYLRVMRNAIAHESDNAVERYERATRALYGALPRQLSPGSQLMQAPPGSIQGLAGSTLFDAAVGIYRLVAVGIVP